MLPTENTLYPIFLKMANLRLLIVGGGQVAIEKLHFLLKSSPDANITVMAPEIHDEIIALFTQTSHQISLIKKPFEPSILQNFDLVIAATNISSLNLEVYKNAKAQKIIVNVADTPHLCDFYMGSIVTRGNLKVAISTNGTSPTFAKRFRQWLEENLPHQELGELLPNLKIIRDRLKLDFAEKVTYLNEVTKSLITKATSDNYDNHSRSN